MVDTRHNFRFIVTRKFNWLLTRFPFYDSIGWQFSIAKLLLPKSNGPCIVKTIYGFDIIVDPKNRAGYIDNDLYYLGSYESGILKVIKSVCGNDSVILDVGANIGAITLSAARTAGRGKVLAFEALPGIADNLRENIKLNKLSNVEVHGVALGPKTGKAAIRPDLTERGSSSIVDKQSSNHVLGKPVTVPVQPLDDFTPKLERVDLIKVDVEGYEAGVFLGARKTIQKHKPVIILEYDPASPLRPKLDRIIKALPYDIFTLSMGKHYRSHLMPLGSLELLPNDKLSELVLLPYGG